MSKIKYDDIQSLEQSWENFAGSSVERFIKKELKNRAGYIYRSRTKEGDYYYLYGFIDYDQYDAWAGGDSSITPLFRVQLPNIENDTFTVNLSTNSNTTKLVNLGEGVIVGLKYTSISTNPSTGVSTDTYNDGTLIIMRSANGSNFSEVARVPIQPTPYADVVYKPFDLTPYLVDGDNKIRMRVEDNINGSISANLNFNSIVNTTLMVENATSTSAPLSALQFHYYIQGQIAKTLHITVSQDGVSETFDYPIGDNTYIEVPYTTPVMSVDNLQSGIISVDSWLSVDGTEVVSNHNVSQFYFSDGDEENTIIILNNVNTNITNYTNQHLFDMTLYNQGTDVEVVVQSLDGQTEFLALEYNNCQTGIVYSVYATTEIESNADSISAMVLVNSENFNCTPYSITIDNTEKMSPTAGASFVLNPKLRNNTEEHPNTIVNAISGVNVNSTFTGFDFINDGWVSDENNIGVLRIPSEHSLTVSYDPLDNLANGTSIELDYKVYNIFNDNDEVVKMYTTNQEQAKLGLVMNATEAAFYTSENQTKRDQDVIFQEGVRTHMVINIVPNLAGSGLNYIRIFVNGILNREMLYSNSDVFKSGDVSMIFGSQNCDIDIYGIRVYKMGLSASDIRQNYMSSLPNSVDKIAFKTANDILSANGTISYDKASVKYNTLVWTGIVPSYSTGNRSFRGKLNINIIGDAEHSGTITNLQIKGQGSSSRGYWKWNHQYDLNKFEGDDSVWTDGNGVEHTGGYQLTSNDPAAKKLVAKLNWASSMQSHKMGSTAMYTDMWKEIVGGNGITNTQGYENVRVSVHEKPFLYFIKETDNSQPVFYGLMTFGSAKYDEPTFGYDENVFPDYLILEGSDNGMPLTLRQVPWFDDEVSYNDEEEYYEYAGQGNLDYGMGNQNMISYFKDAFNFTYLHSPFLVPFSGSIPSDADKKNQYWNVSTKNVFRYDYINQEWVNAGTTKTAGQNEGEYEYDVLNLETQTGLLRSSYDSDSAYNAAVIAWRKADFKSRVGVYYNTTDVLYSMAFLKMIGASDNWCKNTYEYLDPVSHKICLAQDDMDTLMLTDNVGRKTKPYYVEEHDLDSQNKPYFNGSDNVFFNLMEMAFDSEEKAMMKQILTTMRTNYETVGGAVQEYFFSTQEYFPAVAYNETARLLYEEASVKQSQGIYVNGTPAISQSLGDQLQAEKQWWKRRIPYLQSWSSAEPFYTRSTTEPNLQFRSMIDIQGNNPSYVFTLKPWQWLYPKVGTGQFLSSDSTRVPAGTYYNTVSMLTDGNTDTFIYGSNYYTSYGEFGGVSLNETFNLVGDRLLEFSADSREVVNYNFRPSRITVACPELRRFCIYGCSSVAGSLDLGNSTKLESVDLRGTSLNSVVLPQSSKLTTAYLPDLTSIYIVNTPNLNTLSIQGYTNLVNLTTDKSELALDILEHAQNLQSVNLIDVNINTDSNNANAVYSVLANQNITCEITGQIYLAKELTNVEKAALEDKFGKSVWNQNADFRITFIVSDIQSITLTPSIQTYGKFAEGYIDVSYTGNNDASYDWTVSSTDNPLTISRAKNRLSIIAGNLIEAESITITYTITKIGGSTVSGSVNIMLNPYTFSLAGTSLDNSPVINMVYGSGDSSITDSTGWNITCSEEAPFEVRSATISGGSAVISENSIASITKTTLGDDTEHSCSIVIRVNGIDFTYSFKVKTILVSLTINNIADVQCLNGVGNTDVSFSHTSGYDNIISIQSVSVSTGGTNTISNTSLSGCSISFSGYSSTSSKVLTVVYKVNNGSNCTATKNFNVVFIEIGGTVKAKFRANFNVSQFSVGHYIDINNLYIVSGSYWSSFYNAIDTITFKIDGVEYELIDNGSGKFIYDSSYMYVENGRTALSSEYFDNYQDYYNIDHDYDFEVEYKFRVQFPLDRTFYSLKYLYELEFIDFSIINGNYSCGYNYLLHKVSFDSNISEIKSTAFSGCSKLDTIICNAVVAPTIYSETFKGVKYFGTLTYPSGSDYSTWFRSNEFYLGLYHWNEELIESGNFYYGIKDGVASIYGFKDTITGDVVVPQYYTYNDNSYPITKIDLIVGSNSFPNITSLTALYVDEIDYKTEGYTFQNCTSIHVNAPTKFYIGYNPSLNQITFDGTPVSSINFQSSSVKYFGTLTCANAPNLNNLINGLKGSWWNPEIHTEGNFSIMIKGNDSTKSFIYLNNENISGNVVIPNSITEDGTTYTSSSFAFRNGNSNMYSNIIKEFKGNTNITSITLPNFKTDSTHALYGHQNMYTSGSMFEGCTGLTSASIYISDISRNFFKNCTSLSNITLNEGVVNVAYDAFVGTIITSLNLPSTIANFSYSSGVVNYIPSTVSTITGVNNSMSYFNDGETGSKVAVVDNVVYQRASGKIYAIACANVNNITIQEGTYYIGMLSHVSGYDNLNNIVHVNSNMQSISLPSTWQAPTSGSIYSIWTNYKPYLSTITVNQSTALNLSSTYYFYDNNYYYPGRLVNGAKTLYVPQNATGYNTGGWAGLTDSDKCNFTISATL